MIDWEKCLLVSRMLIRMKNMRSKLIPLVLCTMGVSLAVLSGCRKGEEEPVIPPNSPASYMKDPAFMAQLEAKRSELQAIVRERAPLVARMEELVKSNRQDLAVLQKIPEWNDLHKKVVALNAKFEEVRARQLKIVGERIAPARSGKDSAFPLRSGKDSASPLRSGKDSASPFCQESSK